MKTGRSLSLNILWLTTSFDVSSVSLPSSNFSSLMTSAGFLLPKCFLKRQLLRQQLLKLHFSPHQKKGPPFPTRLSVYSAFRRFPGHNRITAFFPVMFFPGWNALFRVERTCRTGFLRFFPLFFTS